MVTDLCLSFLKYSYATGQRSDNSIPWTHIAASDIFLIVKAGKENDADLTMRVVQGSSVLESVDIGRLIDASVQARRKSEMAGIIPQVEQLPIFGMTRNTAVALRVRQKDGQARRLQFRMQNEKECLQVASAFESRGMEFQKQKGLNMRQITPRPGSAMIESRPSSMQTSSPFFQLSPTQAQTRPDPFSRPALEAGSLSKTRPSTSANLTSQSGGFNGDSKHSSLAMPPPKFFTRDESVVPREVEPNRPTTSHMYRALTTPYHRSPLNEVYSESQTTTSPVKRQVSASLVSDFDSIRQEALDFEIQPHDFQQDTLYTNGHEAFDSGYVSSTGINDRLVQQFVDAQSPSPTTDQSAVAAAANPATFEQEQQSQLQNVPFLRPENRDSSNLSAGSRPTSSSLNLPPLPRPKSVRKDISPTKPSMSWSQRSSDILFPPTDAAPTKRSFEVFSERGKVGSGFWPNEGQPYSANASPSKTSDTSSATLSPSKPGPMDEFLARKRPLLQRSANAGVHRIDSTKDAPHETVSPPTTAMSPTKVSKATRSELVVDHGSSTIGNTGPANTIARTTDQQEQIDLNNYAAQSEEDRVTALDDFVIANLENPAFTTLCEDMERCWRRIALGL